MMSRAEKLKTTKSLYRDKNGSYLCKLYMIESNINKKSVMEEEEMSIKANIGAERSCDQDRGHLHPIVLYLVLVAGIRLSWRNLHPTIRAQSH